MNIKNKILISFILFILLIFSFINFSSASFDYTSFTYTHSTGTNQGDYTVILPQNASSYPYIIFIAGESNQSSPGIVFSTSEMSFDLEVGSDYTSFTAVPLDGSSVYYYDAVATSSFNDVWLYGSHTWDLSSYNVEDFKSYSSYGRLTKGTPVRPCSIFYSTYDVYDSDDNLVFQPAPTQVATIPAIQQVVEIPQVMEQAMKVLIPVGLIVFSIGFVIFLTRLIISRLT